MRRAQMHLVASGIVLIILASCVSMARFNYDDIGSLPKSAASVDGFAAFDQHFPTNALTPRGALNHIAQGPADTGCPCRSGADGAAGKPSA